MVIQVVRVSIKPEERERWLALSRMNAELTRSEHGCMSYQVAEDVEWPNTFVIVENWASMEAQYAHFRQPGFSELMGTLGDLLAGPPEVAIYDVNSTMTLDEALKAAGAQG